MLWDAMLWDAASRIDDGCREQYLCVKRIICEGCKKVTWLNGLFNIYTYQFVRWLLRMYLWYLEKIRRKSAIPDTQKSVGNEFVSARLGPVGQMCRLLAVGPTCRRHVGNFPSQDERDDISTHLSPDGNHCNCMPPALLPSRPTHCSMW
jgi:hypothetical protein